MDQLKVDTLVAQATKMTRKEKLLRLVDLVQNSTAQRMWLVHGVEYIHPKSLDTHFLGWEKQFDSSPDVTSPFILMLKDDVFKALGIETKPAGEYALDDAQYGQGLTVQGAMNILEVSQEELHELSCDCGGSISKPEMIARLNRLADA